MLKVFLQEDTGYTKSEWEIRLLISHNGCQGPGRELHKTPNVAGYLRVE